jgi:hypothetical protein
VAPWVQGLSGPSACRAQQAAINPLLNAMQTLANASTHFGRSSTSSTSSSSSSLS